jgi:tRNA(Ile)-lysidine synthase
MALLRGLLLYQRKRQFALHILHIDHAWREESAHEAACLARALEDCDVTVHVERLRQPGDRDLENAARQERLKLYATYSKQLGVQAILLGHHADDQAETVLKRLLAGAPLLRCQGMAEESVWEGVRYWRPFLSQRRADLQGYAEGSGLPLLRDPSNLDLRFLRARMRQKILPELSAQFQKEITKPLARRATEVHRLQSYVTERMAELLAEKLHGPWGYAWDMQSFHIFEVEQLLRTLVEAEGLHIAWSQMEAALIAWEQCTADHRLELGGQLWILDRRRLFLLRKQPKTWVDRGRLAEAFFKQLGSEGQPVDWRSVWQGRVKLPQSSGSCLIRPRSRKDRCGDGRSLHALWSQRKLPLFLRDAFPVLEAADGRVIDPVLGSVKEFGQDTPSFSLHLRELRVDGESESMLS